MRGDRARQGADVRLAKVGELGLVSEIRKKFFRKNRALKVGIGDDCAVISSGKKDLAVTSDMMVEGVHFDLSYTTPFSLGFKLISVNASDVYAMAGKPMYALLDMAFGPNTKKSFLDKFLDGVAEACGLYGISLIGGDISSSKGQAAISATVVGEVIRPVLRSGARPGDGIYVTGSLGDSACGRLLLNKIGRPVDFASPISRPLPWETMEPLLMRHLMPVARDGRKFAKATAMIDISDGLLIDLSRVCDESGVGAKIYEHMIPMSQEMQKAALHLNVPPSVLALAGGEDYELLFFAPPKWRGRAVRIGEATSRERVIVDGSGAKRPLRPVGYEHFK